MLPQISSHMRRFVPALLAGCLAASAGVGIARGQADFDAAHRSAPQQDIAPDFADGDVGAPQFSASPAKGDREQVYFRVTQESQRLEMLVNTSRILTLDFNVPRLIVNNTQIVRATPLSPNQIQVTAVSAGVTQVNVWDEDRNVRSIDVVVQRDPRELENLLARLYPDANLRLTPTQTSVVIQGYVPRQDMVSRIVDIARDFYPNVINDMTVGGVQTVLLHCKVYEVSRTKLRSLGIDWALLTGNDFVIQSVSQLVAATATQGGTLAGGGDTIRFGVVGGNTTFGALIQTLRDNNLAKLLAEPTLTTTNGRAASFNSGGEIPIPLPQGFGVTTVQFREFGTQLDFVPIVLGNGNLRLEVRPQVTEIDPTLRDPVTGTPGFRTRRVDTGVEMRPGQTLVLAGLLQNKVETTNRGIPWLADLPWAGAAFRRTQERINEIELLIMVTPELVDALDPHEVPGDLPGTTTDSPSDVEFYWRGYMEVPKCCTDGTCARCKGQRKCAPPRYESAPAFEGEQAPGAEPVGAPDLSRRGAYERGATPASASSGMRPAERSAALRRDSARSASPRAPARSGSSRRTAPSGTSDAPGLIGPVGYEPLP